MNTPRPLSVRPMALALRMGRIRENGKRAGEKVFDNGGRKPVLLALGAVALIPIKAISLRSHGSRKDRQLYRQMPGLRGGTSEISKGYRTKTPSVRFLLKLRLSLLSPAWNLFFLFFALSILLDSCGVLVLLAHPHSPPGHAHFPAPHSPVHHPSLFFLQVGDDHPQIYISRPLRHLPA